MTARLVGVAAAVAVLAGCTTTVPGSVARTTAPVAAGAVDLLQLDPGNYPTKPRPPLGNADDVLIALRLEGTRMGAFVVGPWQVDPTLVAHGSAGSMTASDVAYNFGKPASEMAIDHHLASGFSSSRSAASDQKGLGLVVLRFRTPEDAAAATSEMAAEGAHQTPLYDDAAVTEYEPFAIPRHPDTVGMVHRGDDGRWSVRAYTAHGPYLLHQRASSTDSADAAAEVIAATLDRQGRLIDQFHPTSIDQLKHTMPLDPDGLLARTLPPDKDHGNTHAPATQLHFEPDPIRAQPVFDAAHLQLVALGKDTVYRTADPASAQQVADLLAAEATETGLRDGHPYVPAGGIKGLPGAKCLTYRDANSGKGNVYCVAVADRYALTASAVQELDVHQQISAQYLMLTGS